jgi:CO/xanthine dehydrogenase Mo-binding subunit/aerobic-type carbon monoxide dehydrogenase small subunit (CoxS/CutS family)
MASSEPGSENHPEASGRVQLTVNGKPYDLPVGEGTEQVSPAHTLAHTLRETLGLTGTKVSCDHGACGNCTVIMDGKAVLSCMTLTVECVGKHILTIEGLKDPQTGELDPLQQAFIDHTAFQCGFCTPGMVMSAKAFLNENPSPTVEEVKEALSGNFCRCISHYHVVKAVTGSPPGGEVASRSEEYKYIGRAIPRRDGSDIVTGTTRYLNDIKMAGLLCAKVLRSPHPHALIKRIEKRKAESLPGVKAVLTWEDVPDWRGGTPRNTRILDRKVRFVGDAVALVAATTEEIATEAIGLIHVEYERLPAVFDMEEALRPDAPQLYEPYPGNIVTPGTPFFGPNSLKELVMGDAEGGFAEADAVAEGTFSYENLPNPLPPEPPGAIALWEEPNKVTLWVSNQASYMDTVTLFHVTNREVDVRTIGGPCGGSFGSKFMSWQVQCHAALLSRATGMPVKLVLTKEEHLSVFTVRPASRMKAKVGMKRDGTVTAIQGRWLIDTGYYSMTTQAQVAVGCGEVQIMVRCANWDLKPVIVCTNRNASGIVRGFGGQELKCILIPLLSLAMEKLHLDPFEFLKNHYVKPGDGYFWRDGKWYTYRGVDYSEAMEKGARLFGWKEKWKGWLKPSRVNGARRRGVGVGVHGNADIGEDASEAYVRLHPEGKAIIFSCMTEHGTGQRSNLAKMVAEVLQLPLENVSMVPADSLINPYEFGPAGSRGTYAIGAAVIRAAEDAKHKLFEHIAPMLQTEPEALDTANGFVFVKGNPDRGKSWKAMSVDRTITGFGRFEPDYSLSNCMMTFVEVEVDAETGKVDLVNVVNATDVGQIIDPPGLEGQLNGCLGSGGIDSAVFEETVIDHVTGHILNPSLIDYKWRTSQELPPIGNVVLETPFPSHRFHAVGVGEVATSPGPSAVLMAVSNALGTWLHEYPATPERVLGALGRLPAGSRERGEP